MSELAREIKNLRAPLSAKTSPPRIASIPIASSTAMSIEKLDLAQIFNKMGYLSLASEAQQYCHISPVHEEWCQYIAHILTMGNGFQPASPPPPEIKKLLKDIAHAMPSKTKIKAMVESRGAGTSAESRAETTLQDVDEVLSRLEKILEHTESHGPQVVARLELLLSKIRELGVPPETVAETLAERMKRRHVPQALVTTIAKTVEEVARGYKSPRDAAINIAATLGRHHGIHSRAVTPPSLRNEKEKEAGLALLRLSGLAPRKK